MSSIPPNRPPNGPMGGPGMPQGQAQPQSAAGASVFQVSPENFQADVVERSQQLPVLLLFWAEQVQPSAAARAQLETLLPQYQGKVAMGLVDVAQDQSLAQHLRVQGLPSVRVVSGGQITEQLDGPQTEQGYRKLLDRLTLSSADVLKAQLQSILDAKDFDSAVAMLQQAINEEPNNMGFRVELADVLVQQGKLSDAQAVLASISDGTEQRERPATRLELAEAAAQLPALDALLAQHADNADDLNARYGLAVHGAVSGDFEAALEHCMTIIQKDRKFKDDLGRLTMLKIFNVLGKGDELATAYRRRLFAFMH